MRLEAGMTLGDYRVVGAVGGGGMGQVYRVEHAITGRAEAMKVLPGQASDPERAGRFLREIRLQAGLNHPNIVPVHNAFSWGEDLLMVMELVEGESLDRVLERGPLPWKRAVSYGRQALAALAYAHGRGVTHRDVKPANLIVTAEGVVKLTDFGLAKTQQDPRLSASGELLGSAYYMAPEQVRDGRAADFRSDLYAVGVVLYEMVTGRRPFEGNGAFAVLRAHVEQSPKPPGYYQPGLPEALNRVIWKALEKKPEDRFASAEEFAAALESLDAEPARQRRGFRTLELAGAGVLALALVLGVWIEGRRVPEPPPAAPIRNAPLPGSPPKSLRTAALPAGTRIKVRAAVTLSSNVHSAGERMAGALEAPLQSGGWIVAEKGAPVEGTVIEAERGGRVRGRARLAVRLTRIFSRDAGWIPVESDAVGREGGSPRMLVLRRGAPAVIPAGAVLEFRLAKAAVVTERGGTAPPSP